jgi:hypothetical protein
VIPEQQDLPQPPELPSRLPKERVLALVREDAGRWERFKATARMDIRDIMRTEGWHTVASMYAPTIFLGWAIYGMLRPAFDSAMSFEPIFWAVGGASLLTLYGKLSTRDIGEDDDDFDEPLDDKWRFTIPHLFRKGPGK